MQQLGLHEVASFPPSTEASYFALEGVISQPPMPLLQKKILGMGLYRTKERIPSGFSLSGKALHIAWLLLRLE